MIILSLDTSGVDCSACLYDSASDNVLGEVCETIGKGHAERLMAVVDAALQQAQLSLQKVERVAVTIGPGSFTGIRVGVAAARGFALSLGIEAVGVTTLETLAQHHLLTSPGRPVAVALDAKRGEAYIQIFGANGAQLRDASVLPVDDAKALLEGFEGDVVGSAATLLAGAAIGSGPDQFPIAFVARAAARKASGQPKPAPLYLRGPDARPQTGFALARQNIA